LVSSYRLQFLFGNICPLCQSFEKYNFDCIHKKRILFYSRKTFPILFIYSYIMNCIPDNSATYFLNIIFSSANTTFNSEPATYCTHPSRQPDNHHMYRYITTTTGLARVFHLQINSRSQRSSMALSQQPVQNRCCSNSKYWNIHLRNQEFWWRPIIT